MRTSLRLLLLTVGLTAVSSSHGLQAQNQGGAASPITEASIRGHMEFLASDAMRGRGSGTDDEWRAAVYIASHLRRAGIEPLGDDGGYVQKIDNGRPQITAPPTIVAGGVTLTHGIEMIVQSTGRGTATGPLVKWKTGVVVPAGSFVIVPEGAAPDAAALAQAAGVLTMETPDVRATWATVGARLPGAGGGRGRGGAAPQARAVVARAAFERLAAIAEATEVAFTVPTKPGYTYNAVGQLKGTDPTMSAQIILLTAHLDHLGVREVAAGVDGIFNGADDDASGSTAVLELMAAIAKGPRPKRTVMFAWFGSEESGGAGARNFLTKPPAPLTSIVANLEFEMIANRDDKVAAHTLWLTGYDCSNLGPELAKQGARIVADPHPEEGFFRRSDNIQLARQGIIAQTVSSYDAKGATYHKASDDVAHVDFGHMTDSIQSMLAPVLWLSNSGFTPAWLEGKNPKENPNGCGGR